MKKTETVELFAIIKSLFPRDEAFRNATPDMVSAWTEMLEDIPFEIAKAAVKAAVATSPFPPSIAEIRDYATRLTGPKRLIADEAWGIACEVMREYGLNTVPVDGFTSNQYDFVRFGEPVRVRASGLEYEAKRHCPPEVWALLERMGYRDVCMSDAPDVVRGQFMRAWSARDKQEREARVIAGVVPAMLEAIMGPVVGQIGGVE